MGKFGSVTVNVRKQPKDQISTKISLSRGEIKQFLNI